MWSESFRLLRVVGNSAKAVRVTCIIFGPNPSALVRGSAREKRALESGILWKTLQLEPYFDSLIPHAFHPSLRRKLLRFIGKVLSPIIFIFQLKTILDCDVLYVIKSPPLWMSRIIRKIKAVKVLDFDDPIWIESMNGMNWFRKTMDCFDGFTCDNEIVLSEVSGMGLPEKNGRGLVLVAELSMPTNVDQNIGSREISSTDEFNISWVGSYSTFNYVYGIKDALRVVLTENPNMILNLYGPTQDQIDTLHLPTNQLNWRSSYGPDEMADLLVRTEMGLFPLDSEPLSYLRGTHKVNTYSAFGVPTIASDVPGMDRSLVPGLNGFICRTDNEWVMFLNETAKDRNLLLNLSLGSQLMHKKYLEEMYDSPKRLIKFAAEINN